MSAVTRKAECNGEAVLFLALELSDRTWKVGTTVTPAQKARTKNVSGGDLGGLRREIARAKKRFGLTEEARVVSCYEAGREGFWIHRWLEAEGVINAVVDPASIDVNRRKRRAKTDRLDVFKLLSNLMRWWGGEEKVWSVVVVPSVRDEDARHFHRERETLKKERTAHTNRIKCLLKLHGISLKRIEGDFVERLREFRLSDGNPLPPQIRQRLEREYQRLVHVEEQIELLARQRSEALRRSTDKRIAKVRKLTQLRGTGEVGAWIVVMEVLGWRVFRNRRQLGSLIGLTGTPSDSGDVNREQGIDKAGNALVRKVLIEMAWNWVRWQPDSEITQWFNRKFGGAGKRHRRIGIVGVARRLVIAYWRYLEQDVEPKGAVILKAT
jgi:transposase